MTRYFLSQDSSCHWYLVPEQHRQEWETWCDIPEEDERAWDAPEFAKRLGGSPGMLTFAKPLYDGKQL